MRVSRGDVRRAWSLGLNWVVFLVAWFIFSAIIGKACGIDTVLKKLRNSLGISGFVP